MQNPKLSIITPTIRPEGLEIVEKSLSEQSETSWEWLICSPFKPKTKKGIWVPDMFKGGFWTLNRAYNALARRAKGELIISWQDYIRVLPDGLKKFWLAYKDNPHALYSGVGDQYDKTGLKVWDDPRKRTEYGSFYEVYYNDIEFNWAAIPKKAFYDVGGFDEQLDFLGYGGDQLQFCERLNDDGWKFFIDQTNESFTLRHGREDFGGEQKWNKDHVLFNGEYDKRKEFLQRAKQWPKLCQKSFPC